MNKLIISQTKTEQTDNKTFFVQFGHAADFLTMLRNDHFINLQIALPRQINNSQLKFLMHIKRILNPQGQLVVKGQKLGISKAKNILKSFGLYITHENDTSIVYTKKEKKVEETDKRQHKLAIGFKNISDQQIDEDDLLKNQNIDLSKQSAKGCGEKIRACANCNCGLKKDDPLPSKQELVQSVNEGKPVSGCGKCYLGDSFRCATCPYQGLPAFKPGDKLKLVDESKVIVENATTSVSNGVVKLEL